MSDDQINAVEKALNRAWNLGQTYWQQADSQYASMNRKSDETRQKFLALVDETKAALSRTAETQPVAWKTTHPAVCVPITEDAEIATQWRALGYPVYELFGDARARAMSKTSQPIYRYSWVANGMKHDPDGMWALASDVQPVVRVPEGWRLVPIDPDSRQLEAMCESYWDDGWDDDKGLSDARIVDARNMYRAGLYAAPQAPAVSEGARKQPDWQQKALDYGFQYWRASDAHGVIATKAQAVELLEDLLGVEVEIKDDASNPTARAEGGEAVGWESTTIAYTKYITDAKYRKLRPEYRKWYKPYRCSECAARDAQAGQCTHDYVRTDGVCTECGDAQAGKEGE